MGWLEYLIPVGAVVGVGAGFGAVVWGIMTVIQADKPDND